MSLKKLVIIIISSSILFSCNDYLDVDPVKQTRRTIETVEDLDLLLNQPLVHHTWSNQHAYCTDNFGLDRKLYKERPENYPLSELQQFLWQTKISEAQDSKWDKLYRTIWDANMIINSVDENTVSGDEVLKANVKAEAHLLRAYCFFELAVGYALHPTTENMNMPGIPLRLGTDFEESLERASIQETYNQIEADLNEALKLNVHERKAWRASIGAVNAFAARYYLYTSDYAKAKLYADAALEQYSVMINYETSISLVENDDYEYPSTWTLSFASPADLFNFWEDQYLFKYITIPDEFIVPSQELLDLYDSADLRYQYFMVENFSKFYSHTFELRPGYMSSYRSMVVSGPSVPEMYLIRAECNARGEGSIADAMNDVEEVRRSRFAAADYEALAIPSSKKTAVEQIIDERRREFPFSLRWYDLRRINADELLEPITIERKFWKIDNGEVETSSISTDLTTYTLEPGSKLYARPLNNSVIQLSNGQTLQNEYN